MRQKVFYISIGFAVVVNIAARLISIQSPRLYHIFFKGEAITFIFLAIAIRCTVINDLSKSVAESLLLLTISNLIDELFFNPERLQWNEIIAFVIALLWVKYGSIIRPKLWKKLNKKQQPY